MAASEYQQLDESRLLATLGQLRLRIAARFPTRNLARVAAELSEVIGTDDEAESVRRESMIRRLCWWAGALIVALAFIALVLAVRDAVDAAEGTRAFEWLPVIESAINDVVFAGIAVFFLHSVPARRERRRTLAVLHRLRALAHVIDMHQLTKDPERLREDFPATQHSPRLDMTAVELGRYLDYCSELLSLVGKGAALRAQASSDAVVLDTVSEIETLTLGMSRKIWQKIALLSGG